MKAHIARREVELLIISRIVGDVHLAILARNRAILFQDDGRIMIQTRCAALKEGYDEHDAVLPRQFAKEICRRAGYRLCQIKVVDIFYLTEVGRIVQFLQHHELCALLSRSADVFSQSLAVVISVGRAGLLD